MISDDYDEVRWERDDYVMNMMQDDSDSSKAPVVDDMMIMNDKMI